MKPIQTLALPGDADSVLEWEIARAIHRDGRLNWAERKAKMTTAVCRYCRQQYEFWYCTRSDPCFYCEELDLL